MEPGDGRRMSGELQRESTPLISYEPFGASGDSLAMQPISELDQLRAQNRELQVCSACARAGTRCFCICGQCSRFRLFADHISVPLVA